MIVGPLEQLRETCQITVFEKEREDVHLLRDYSQRVECWMNDLYDYDCGLEDEPPEDESWMDDLDDAA